MVSIKFRAMTKNDYEMNSNGIVRSSSGFRKYEGVNDLSQDKLFGLSNDYLDDCEVNVRKENYRGYIKLPWPIVNEVLAGPNGSLLAKVLGKSMKDIQNIINFSSVYFVESNFIVNYDPVHQTYGDYLLGGEAIKAIIDVFDIQQAIEDELNSKIAKLVNKSAGVSTKEKYLGYFSKGTGSYKGIKDYFFTPNELSAHRIKQEHVDDAFFEYLRTDSERLTYLINLKDKEPLYGMLLNYLMVTPFNTRPTIKRMLDQFTKQYGKISDIVVNIQNLNIDNLSIEEVKTHYSRLTREVRFLVYKSDEKNEKTFSFTEKIKGKKGFIRSKMLGKREDYSGRSVITVNPGLSIDQIALPKEIIVKGYRYHHVKAVAGIKTFSDVAAMSVDDAYNEIKILGILDKVPAMLNRAPTLHRLSFLGFKVELSKTKSIELNPLVTTGFNADFDGDAMGVHIPLGAEAIKECYDLMLPSNNLYHPANGKPILVPKMEMVYGLNQATKEYPATPVKKTYSSYEEILDDVKNHRVKIYDTVSLNGSRNSAGRFAVDAVIPESLRGQNIIITSKTISRYTDALLKMDKEVYVKSVDQLVQLGFRMAKLYTPTISVLDKITHEGLTNPLESFYDKVKNISRLYELGLEDEDRYNQVFSEAMSETRKYTEQIIPEALGEDNGFLQLVLSGARGSIGNLQQIYSYKGQIQKSDYESFSAVIERGFAQQLLPLQHFISAYGTRKGLIDKVQKTGDTGYAGRLMYQAASDWVITNDDCGTKEGLFVNKNEITKYIKGEDSDSRSEQVSQLFYNIIKDRYSTSGSYITPEEAHKLAHDPNVVEVEIRSPLSCIKPCCKKCYGLDLSTGKLVSIGMPIGFVAGQAIGEPGTQLTMRTFQKGGVAGKKDVTSNFDRMNKFLGVSDFSKMRTYDPIAWASGQVVEEVIDDFTKRIKIVGSKGNVVLPIDADLVEIAEKGKGLCTITGDHNVKELIKYANIKEAQRYLYFAMSTCYLGQADIDSKHFETLVASMTVHMVLRTDREDLKPGLMYTSQRLYEGDSTGTVYRSTLKSVKKLPLLKDSPLSNILMEDYAYGISRACLLGLEDKMDTQMGRLMLSLKPKLGTMYQEYCR